MLNNQTPFWKTKTLQELTRQEWESLCDGCGLCCLQKLEDRKTGRIDYTNVSCYLLDTTHCRCRSYENRMFLVKECLELTPGHVVKFRWLPKTCAYRLLAAGKELYWWHPLVSGEPDTVHQAGISFLDKEIISEDDIIAGDLLKYLIINLSKYFFTGRKW
jgi:uncharacterized cysteine cluster protein YcgN (CxxCxxCC family)